MRVITRHSKLLYFLKHLPRWQFLSLSAIVATEATVRGTGSSCPDGTKKPARGERSARSLGRLRNEGEPRGRDVLTLAEAVAYSREEQERSPVMIRPGVLKSIEPCGANVEPAGTGAHGPHWRRNGAPLE